MIVPKFHYGSTDFTPTWPPKGKEPVNELQVTKTDSYASEGQKQSVIERVDEFQNLVFPVVTTSDLSSFSTMYASLLLGTVVTYYPDSTDSSTHTDFWLEDTGFNPKFVSPGAYSLTMRLRKVVT